MEKHVQWNIWYVIVAIVAMIAFNDALRSWREVQPLAYSEFLEQLDAGNVKEIRVSADRIEGTLERPLPDGRTRFATVRIDPALAQSLAREHVKFSGVIQSTLLRDVLGWVIPALLFFGLWSFLLRRFGERSGLGGGLMSIGRSKAKVYVETGVGVTFADVAGVDEAKEELGEVVGFLKDPGRYGRLGARIPKGILLVGPPGTGKTLLARAVAGEAGVPFFSINGSEFVEMFVGVGAARVRDLFEQARKAAPAIIFIDELDALGRARGAGTMQGGNDEREQTLNQLLSELDGFDPGQGVVLLSATNRPEILDPALLRAGRFDRQVLVDRPDRAGRVQILQVHMKKIVLAPDMGVEDIAALTTGFSGADLANLVNEAALLATRRRAKVVSMEDFTHAIERIVAGLEKRNRLINPRERRIVAYHEMGHALVSMALPGMDEVHKVSIIPRGVGALGYTIQRPTEDRFLMTEHELRAKIAVLMGGRAAEKLVFDHLSTGAADDLARATDIARSMVARYGMDAELGSVSYETERNNFLGGRTGSYLERNYSEATAQAMDAAVRTVLHEVFAQALEILAANRALLDVAATRLLEVETLDEGALRELARDLQRPQPVLVQ